MTSPQAEWATPHVHLYAKYPANLPPVQCYYNEITMEPGDRITYQGVVYEALIDMQHGVLVVMRDDTGAQVATPVTGEDGGVSNRERELVGAGVR